MTQNGIYPAFVMNQRSPKAMISLGDDMKMLRVAGIVLAIVIASPTYGATYMFSFTGQINGLGASDRTLLPTALTETELRIGDLVSGSIRFTPRRSVIDHDGIFFPGGQDFRLTIGGYAWSSSASSDVFNQIVLGNNAGNAASYDSFMLTSLIYGSAPFAGWSDNPAIIFSYSFYDYTANMLSSGDILSLPAVGVFPIGGTASVSFNSLGGATGRIVSASLGNLRAQLVDTDAAVPEPATWATLLTGFAVLGYTLRRQQSNLRASQA